MIEQTGNLWEVEADATVITTNGFVKRDGRCVMGRGCAREAASMYPTLPGLLGGFIRANGNRVGVWDTNKHTVVTFPVKHNWWEPADLELISNSLDQLVELTEEQGWEKVVLPRPGCGNGHLEMNIGGHF